MGDYAIYLSFNNQEEGFRIPVNPESIEIKEGAQGKTYDIVGSGDQAGEINVIKSKKLLDISFSSIFPASHYPFVVAPLLEPMRYVNFIKGWMRAKRPIRFIYAGRVYNLADNKADINIAASIESFTWKEVAGSPGDIEYSLELKEYRFYSALKAEIAQVDGQTMVTTLPPDRPDERERPTTYTLIEGDYLWKVAHHLLGDGSRYKEIQVLNGIRDCDLKKLPIGLEILLPED